MTGIGCTAAAGRARQHLVASIALLPLAALAQSTPPLADAKTLDAVQVIARSRPLSQFPGAVSVIKAGALRDGQRQVSLSESLSRVPGITVLDRQNLAQDLQIQTRGFGARSTFGIRGIKLVVDGIPASAADGQGQAGNFVLGALDRIEVLRGPLALQYGNAAGGALVATTGLSPGSALELEAWASSEAAYRVGMRATGASHGDGWRWTAHGNRFSTDGERPHSAAVRAQFNAVAQWSPGAGQRLRIVANGLSQPWTQDPLGITRALWQSDPHATDPAATQFDTRKSIENQQLGAHWENPYADDRDAWVGVYGIRRNVVQFLALPVGAQVPASNSGGVIDLGRASIGIDAGHRWTGARGALAIGFEAGRLDETRRGYENFVGMQLGVRGRLRRDEANRVDNRELYAVADWRLGPRWTVLAGMRRTHLSFVSEDFYLAPGNGDDSGRFSYRETAASLGVARAFDGGEVFASAGRGFETPTITELAYRSDGVPGFNRALTPAHVRAIELGARWRWRGADASIVTYRIEGNDEVVPAESRGGRASFANAGRTRRAGLEASLSGNLGARWSFALAANLIEARFTQSFAYRVVAAGQTSTRSVQAGNRIPGIPRADAFAELAWHDRGGRVSAAFEARFSDRIATDDRNSDFAPGHARLAARMQWRGAGRWQAFVRIDNLFDRSYIGSVIVNEGNARFFEPGAGRSMTVGIGYALPR